MAPDTDLLRDIGIVAFGIILFILPVKNIALNLFAYLCVGYGIAHILFRVNLDKTTGRVRK